MEFAALQPLLPSRVTSGKAQIEQLSSASLQEPDMMEANPRLLEHRSNVQMLKKSLMCEILSSGGVGS